MVVRENLRVMASLRSAGWLALNCVDMWLLNEV
jgi:hypothetical protein